MTARTVSLLVLLLLLQSSRGLTQGCCTPGSSPLAGLTGGSLLAGNVEVGLAVEGYQLRQAYRGNDQTSDPAQRYSQVLTSTLYTRIGLHNRIAAILRLPYEYRARDQTVVLGRQTFRPQFSARALGDLSTLLIIRVLPLRSVAAWGVNLGAGVKWPTGPYNRTQWNELAKRELTVPVELQTGTGSLDPIVSFASYRSWSRMNLIGSAVARFPREGKTGYQFGDELQLAVVGLWSWLPSLQLGGELRARFAGRDEFNGVHPINTGATRWTSGLRILKEFAAGRGGLEAAFLLPFYQNLTGLQLGVDRQLSLNMRWRLR